MCVLCIFNGVYSGNYIYICSLYKLLSGEIHTMIGYYKGCIKQLYLNQHYLTSDTMGVKVINDVAIKEGCHGDDVCSIGQYQQTIYIYIYIILCIIILCFLISLINLKPD